MESARPGAGIAFSVLVLALLQSSGCFHRTRIPIQTGPPAMAALGDSLSEGEQSADANRETQPVGYASLIALQMRGSFPLPLISISPVGVAGSTFLRHRIHPDVISADLGVSGATVSDTLATSAQPGTNNEYDLVLSPRNTTEIGAAVASPAPLILYWAGTDDVIRAILSFDKLDGSQITPATTFRANFTRAMAKLKALGRPVVVGNIPDVTQIAFLMDRRTLAQYAGSDFGLAEGSYTTLITALLLRLHLEDTSILQNGDYTLDPTEIAHIRQSVSSFNAIIADAAGRAGFPVVDVHAYFEDFVAHPPAYGGATLSNRYLGGMFSLDGIHPSDISYALLANDFIRVIDSRYGRSIPPLTGEQLDRIARHDPFVDVKGDGRVRGRFGAGLLETLAPIVGLKHDVKHPETNRSLGERFMAEYRKRMRQATPKGAEAAKNEVHDAMRHMFGLDALKAE